MNKVMKKVFMGVFVMALAGMVNAQSKSDRALEKVRKTIEASNAVFSDLANKNDGSILSRYTADACLLPANAAPVCGAENIGFFFKDGPKVHSIFTIQHLYGNGQEFVTEESYYQMTDLSGKKLDEGKVVVIWKKTADGWKMHRDMFSSNHQHKN
jgi:ketosteroid isomerase-like protein